MQRVVMVGLAAVVASACSSDSARTPAQPDGIAVPLRVESAQHADTPHNHSVHLSGDQEVFTPATPDAPTPADTLAQGQAILHISKDGQSFDYKLIASNIENITQAHIHSAPPGANGDVVAWLYPSGPPPELLPGRHNGVLSQGTLTDADLVGPLAGATLGDLVQLLADGGAYVNVHTSQFPGGEIRGQIR